MTDDEGNGDINGSKGYSERAQNGHRKDNNEVPAPVPALQAGWIVDYNQRGRRREQGQQDTQTTPMTHYLPQSLAGIMNEGNDDGMNTLSRRTQDVS